VLLCAQIRFCIVIGAYYYILHTYLLYSHMIGMKLCLVNQKNTKTKTDYIITSRGGLG
jgi:hypothetical protein